MCQCVCHNTGCPFDIEHLQNVAKSKFTELTRLSRRVYSFKNKLEIPIEIVLSSLFQQFRVWTGVVRFSICLVPCVVINLKETFLLNNFKFARWRFDKYPAKWQALIGTKFNCRWSQLPIFMTFLFWILLVRSIVNWRRLSPWTWFSSYILDRVRDWHAQNMLNGNIDFCILLNLVLWCYIQSICSTRNLLSQFWQFMKPQRKFTSFQFWLLLLVVVLFTFITQAKNYYQHF